MATSLDVTINILKGEEHDVIRKRLLDLLDSVNIRIVRLTSIRERLGKRLKDFRELPDKGRSNSPDMGTKVNKQ